MRRCRRTLARHFLSEPVCRATHICLICPLPLNLNLNLSLCPLRQPYLGAIYRSHLGYLCPARSTPPPQPALIFSVLLAPDSLRSTVPCLSLRSRTPHPHPPLRSNDQTTDRPTLDTRHSTPSGALPPPLARDPRAIRRTPPPLVRSPLNRLAQPCPGSQLPGLCCRSCRSRPLTSL